MTFLKSCVYFIMKDIHTIRDVPIPKFLPNPMPILKKLPMPIPKTLPILADAD